MATTSLALRRQRSQVRILSGAPNISIGYQKSAKCGFDPSNMIATFGTNLNLVTMGNGSHICAGNHDPAPGGGRPNSRDGTQIDDILVGLLGHVIVNFRHAPANQI